MDSPSSQLLPNALRLSQSRARLAEEQLRAMEESCRDAWHTVLRREQECLLELRKAELERTATEANIMRQRGRGGEEERILKATCSGHGGLTMQICFAPQLDDVRNISARNYSRDCLEESELYSVGEDSYDERGRAAMASVVQKVMRLEQQSASLSATRMALETHLSPFLFPNDGGRSLYSWKQDGRNSMDRVGNGGVWSSYDLMRMHGHGNFEGCSYGEEGKAVRIRSMEECHLAELHQRVQVAERAAREAMQRASSESHSRITREQALHLAMECCQRELHNIARKLEESQKQCDGLKKENKRLARRLRHQARLLGGDIDTPPVNPCELDKDSAEVEEIGCELTCAELHSSQSSLQLLSAAGACLCRGLDRALAFVSRLFVTHPNGIQITHSCEGPARSREFSDGGVSGLAPSLCTAWETGPMWEIHSDDGGEFDGGGLFGEVWDEWGDGEGVSFHSSHGEESSWHTVFFIQVIFTWQEAVGLE